MPTINRKRRSQGEPQDSPPPATRRRRSSPSATSASGASSAENGENTQTNSQEQMVKKLVRLALASEYSRIPIRRSDISAKVMPPGTGRQFKTILAEANTQLAAVFGMALTELPQKEKMTVTQKRAAQRAGTQSQGGTAGASNKAYILTSTLPSHYRTPSILPPARIPSAGAEGGYYGLTSFILALIYLSPGQQLSEMRLEKHLKRMNADEYCLGGERKENVLKKMIKERYIDKIRERDQGGEETVDYVVGPRGKVELGERGVAGLVRRVYGKEGAEGAEVERRLVRSLGEGVRIPSRRRETGGNDDGDDDDEGEDEAGEPGEGTKDQGTDDSTNRLADGEAEEGGRRKRGRPASGKSSVRRSGKRTRDEEDAEEEEDEEGEDEEEE